MAKQTKHPWHKQPGEVESAYRAFKVFVRSDRKYISVARRTGKPHTTISNWGNKYKWNARAEAWDIWRDQQLEANEKKRLEEMAKRHVDESIILQQKGIERLANLKPEQITPTVAVRMVEVGITIERRTFGDPKQLLNNRNAIDSGEQIDLSKLTDDELADYERLISKAKQ
jgi:hypothetical protein